MPKNSKISKRTGKSDDGSSSDSDREDENVSFDKKEYRKFLNQIFPSKYLEKKIKNDEKNDNSIKNKQKMQIKNQNLQKKKNLKKMIKKKIKNKKEKKKKV